MGVATRFSYNEPRFPGFRGREDRENSLDGVTEHVDVSVLSPVDRIEKPIFIRIREDQLPRVAAVGGFVEAREIAFAARHHDRGVRVEGLDAAEVEMFGAGRNRARLPQIAAVFGAQNRAVRARGPRHPTAHVVDAAQIGGRAGVLDLPLSVGRAARSEQQCD